MLVVQGIALSFLIEVITSLYVLYCMKKWKTTKYKSFALLCWIPCFILFLIVPDLCFNKEDQIVAYIFCYAVVSWWSSFKALAVLLGQQPLQNASTLSLLLWIWFPLTMNDRSDQEKVSETSPQLLLRFVLKLVLVWGLVNFLVFIPSAFVCHVIYAFLLYLFCSLLLDLCAAICKPWFPLDIHFDKPFLSNSLSDFWSKRWNVQAAKTLYYTVYLSICPNTQRYYPQWRKLAAVICTFVVSGIMHELLLFRINGKVTGHWFIFFTLHGVLLVIEKMGSKRFHYSGTLSFVLGRIWCLCLLIITSEYFFWRPILDSGLVAKAVSLFSIDENYLERYVK
ncbi:hypothetical protein GpartN1_g4585.t1 [Galdieria partita]|uniref:Wax synthase domain-containing protein n=1 Tax=Galdieria partita TaxID=83374 RepID=A0A9C7PYA5_9RHOD|nr:hypothetical protein GpartN1_g4585.t1 [Galdieria partita]